MDRLIRLELDDEGVTVYYRDRIDQPWDDSELDPCFMFHSYAEAADLIDALKDAEQIIRERAQATA